MGARGPGEGGPLLTVGTRAAASCGTLGPHKVGRPLSQGRSYLVDGVVTLWAQVLGPQVAGRGLPLWEKLVGIPAMDPPAHPPWDSPSPYSLVGPFQLAPRLCCLEMGL